MARKYDRRLTELLHAVSKNDNEFVRAQFKKGYCHADARDGDFTTALLVAAVHGNYAIAEFLIDLGARVNEGNQLGITPVLAACANGHLRTLHLLIKHGGDLRPSDLGMTPLGMACAYGHLAIVKYLITAGHPVETISGSISPSPLMLAALNNHESILMYFLLPSLKASGRIAFIPEETREAVSEMLSNIEGEMPFIDIDATTKEFFDLNVLALVAVTHNRDMFELLCELGADLRFRLKSGRTIKEVAARYGFDVSRSFSESSASNESLKSTSTARLSRRSIGAKSDKGFRRIRGLVSKFLH